MLLTKSLTVFAFSCTSVMDFSFLKIVFIESEPTIRREILHKSFQKSVII